MHYWGNRLTLFYEQNTTTLSDSVKTRIWRTANNGNMRTIQNRQPSQLGQRVIWAMENLSSVSERYDIAVVVCTYNSDADDVFRTLASILIQRNVSFQIIIADDGSENAHDCDIRAFFESNGFLDYSFSCLARNNGTVINILNALYLVNAPFVALISPGDFFYDDNVLDCYVESLSHGADIAFGKGVHYSVSETLLIHHLCHPVDPRRYNTQLCGNRSSIKEIAVYNDGILGAAMAYRTKTLQQSLELIKGHVKYVEDNTTLAVVLLSGGIVRPIDRYTVWHEHGTGISTSGNSVWESRISTDYCSFWKLMERCYPDNKLVASEALFRTIRKQPQAAGGFMRLRWRFSRLRCLPRRLLLQIKRKMYRCRDFDLSLLEAFLWVDTEEVLRKK